MDNPARRRFVRNATLGYGALAALWILLSDGLLPDLSDPEQAYRLSLIKGITFVVFTAALLYVALSRVPDRALPTPSPQPAAANRHHVWHAYLVAVVGTSAVVVLGTALGTRLDQHPMLVLYITPVIVSAMLGGLWPGLLATLIGALGTNFFAIAPYHSLAITSPLDRLLWGLLIVNGGLISVLSEWLHRALRRAEASARELTERARTLNLLSAIADRTSEAVFAKNLQGRYLLVNEVASRLLGRPMEDVLDRTDLDLFPPDQARQLEADDREVIEGGRVRAREETLTIGGRAVTLMTTKAPLRDETGRIIGMFGVSHDVTATRETEAQIRRSEARLRTLLAALHEGIIVFDADGRVLSCNPAAEHILGLSEAQLISEFHDLANWRAVYEDGSPYAVDALPVARTLSTGAPCHGEVLGVTRADGTIVWMIVNAVLLADDDARVIASFTDISDRVRSERELRKLSQAIEQNPSGVLIADTQGRIEYVNAAFGRKTGYTLDQIRGQNPRILQSGATPRATYESLWATLVRGDTWSGELHNRRKDGSDYVDLTQISPLRSADGRVTHYVAIQYDITEEKRRAEELEQYRTQLESLVEARTQELTLAKQQADAANAAKSAFLATMSHEIRTPMNGVVGMIEILSRSELSEHQLELIDTVQQSASTLLRIIDDILDFSKIEAGHLPLERVPIALSDIVDSLCTSMFSVATSKNVELTSFVDPGIPEAVLGDGLRVRQVLYNLIGNAIKFSAGRPGKRGRVSVRVQAVSQTPLQIRFTIADNGIGMAPETVARLFTAFTQAEVSTTRRFGGTGLGLAICKRLVDAMHGQIRVESRLGEGSVFTVILPFDPAPVTTSRPRPDVSGLDCIVLDNGPYAADDLCVYLRHDGARARTAANAEEAVALARGLQQPIVIRGADWFEPTKDAMQARLTEAAPQSRQVLITPGQRRWVRQPADAVVSLDFGRLGRQALLFAVAIAAGRCSINEMPVAVGPDERHAAVVPPSVEDARAAAQLILVAEDDPINQKVILEQLRLLGYAAEVAGNGAEALHLWRQNEYALLLTDVHMPDIDGYTLARTIRMEEGGGRHMPILALSANALRGEGRRAKEAGIDDYLVKPVQIARLGEALTQWMPAARPAAPPPVAPTTDAGAGGSVDLSVLQRLVGTDPAVISDLLRDFRATLESQIAAIQADLERHDLRKVQSNAHRLKSSSRSVGALPLGDLCASVENACALGNHDAVATLVPELVGTAAAVAIELDALIAPPGAGDP